MLNWIKKILYEEIAFSLIPVIFLILTVIVLHLFKIDGLVIVAIIVAFTFIHQWSDSSRLELKIEELEEKINGLEREL